MRQRSGSASWSSSPPAAGGSFGKRVGELLQDLHAHPTSIDRVSTQLEEAAKKAYD
jgi:hypothetical protein